MYHLALTPCWEASTKTVVCSELALSFRASYKLHKTDDTLWTLVLTAACPENIQPDAVKDKYCRYILLMSLMHFTKTSSNKHCTIHLMHNAV